MDGNPVLLRNSERATFKRCPQQWWWSYVDRLAPSYQDSTALWFGTGMHLVWAEFYIPGRKRGRNPLETWREYCDGAYQTVRVASDVPESRANAVDAKIVAEWVDAKALGDDMIEFYMDTYKGDPDWEIIAPEQRFRVAIPSESLGGIMPESKPNAILLVGTFDLVIRDHTDGRLKIVDHKTAAQLPSQPQLEALKIDDQNGTYLLAAEHSLRAQGLINTNEKVAAAIYNFLVKRRVDSRPQNEYGKYLNKDGTVSKVQPLDPLLRHTVWRNRASRNEQIRNIRSEVAVMDLMRNGSLDVYKTPTRDCCYCDFFDMCEVKDSGGDWKSFRSGIYQKHDPYADHREGADNSKTSVGNKKRTGTR